MDQGKDQTQNSCHSLTLVIIENHFIFTGQHISGNSQILNTMTLLYFPRLSSGQAHTSVSEEKLDTLHRASALLKESLWMPSCQAHFRLAI